MNLCIINGKVTNEIDLKFVYNLKEKSLDKKHISIVVIYLKLDDEEIVKLHAYNNMADCIYKTVNKGDYILIEGIARGNYIEIKEIYNWM